jgi:hypothetical protein
MIDPPSHSPPGCGPDATTSAPAGGLPGPKVVPGEDGFDRQGGLFCQIVAGFKKEVRGIRPIERKVEGRQDAEAEVIRGYCAAVRSALTDDGRPPLEASGLKLADRLAKLAESLDRVAVRRGSRGS